MKRPKALHCRAGREAARMACWPAGALGGGGTDAACGCDEPKDGKEEFRDQPSEFRDRPWEAKKLYEYLRRRARE